MITIVLPQITGIILVLGNPGKVVVQRDDPIIIVVS